MRPFRECLRGLFATLRPLRWRVALSAFLGLLQVAASLSFVWSSKRVVDIATGEFSGSLLKGVILFAGILLILIILRTVSRYWEGFVVVNAQNDTRSKVFERVMRSIWQGKERFHSGDTINRLEEDIRVVVDFLCVSLPDLLVTVCQFIAASIFLFSLSPQLGWILILLCP